MPQAARPVRPRPARPTVWRITDRAGFVALRRRGRRASHAGITVTWAPADPEAAPGGGSVTVPPRVAYTVGRTVGGSVARNRVRRRLRAAMSELAARGSLPAGTYLVGGGPALRDRPWTDLVDDLAAAVARTSAGGAR